MTEGFRHRPRKGQDLSGWPPEIASRYQEMLTRAHARAAVYRAVQDGRLIKPTRCPRCGTGASGYRMQAHHHDYERPLEVEWMCHQCHQDHHSAA